MGDPQTVKISVYGKEYSINSPESSETTQEYAVFIDKIMKEIGRKTGSLDPVRVATLALLQITHEYFTLRKNVVSMDDEYEKRMGELMAHLRDSIPD